MNQTMNGHHPREDDDIAPILRFCPDPCVPPAPQGLEAKPRRRRKRIKGEHSGITGTKKRKLSQDQVTLLEQYFGDEHKLESRRKHRLAAELGLDPRQVAVWFQNRRARYKCEKLEEEYSRLRAAHEEAVVEKCRLEAELMRLKDRLSESEEEIQRLAARLGTSAGAYSDSLMSSFLSVDFPDRMQFPGEYTFDGILFLPDGNRAAGMGEWVDLYM